MSEIKLPTAGRIVHYFPNGQDNELGYGHAEKLAAIVVDGGDMAPCLAVFTKWSGNPVVIKLSVQHKSHVQGFNPIPAYWDWLEIK
ncbi:hypothetical protein [Chitinophaga sp.]|uniref:hypothetical protein n=1 Tax=Chitinophaga sp. TaxID=1869181 RepID=UPI002C49412C|nr:hypothetical protein [Chitinophaga sp.]HWV69520.1 hypothetical protein [Chitinophaga sp.]